ncbi:MAG: peptide-methionine (S)-S-oxide reductase [Rhodanobacter sp. 68-29]|uniref:peptide-methionine (S)-S-oxide reductase MsrA n=1 Tax=Rhodanobacter sp. PCA2 TaxID=2006117 RepID=UPI00086A5C3A|nr:peptide-methionine (S)-S-oxide reductase MsrA [Rhodanobacter sp. PCA2]MBA2078653.1 peptide-methionine (S)-S-oxide reductase [Rhodanobacter sp. PCA2]MBN8921786.1 peptide-methionine (S)-S-oxide reductase MsrA [Rhodanobacter sp.]ODU72646.1 MAG: peptide-methionine (S)-S-oxide reductase [Rhodanobacter sp. SCN 69-32]OJY61231.1 MAG: peptide-methionine (S)-S-oxide reductase [Rhodanobacter sp. 68-29]
MSARPRPVRSLAAALLFGVLGACALPPSAAAAAKLPPPALDAPRSAAHGEQVAVFAGGCFWGVQEVFNHVRGVRKTWAGYSGGSAATAHYDQVSDGGTGHAESVKLLFDPAQVSYGQLLQVFFSVATDPTQLDRQGPDSGTQYRSVVFYATPEQQRIADAYLAQLGKAGVYTAPIVTRVAPLQAFYPAEGWHQDYARRHPGDPYIAINDAPKVRNLKGLFPALYW